VVVDWNATLLLLSATAALGWLAVDVAAWLGARAAPSLDEVPPDPDPPAVSVVIPCRNEARGVEAAVRSLLAQDLPGLQLVAVDDRSEDRTGAILDGLAATDPRLAVVHLTALPPGWLGKNHALDAGGRRATGAWILFTDGDVVFAPDALRRALALARARGLGHLAVAPRFLAGGFLERAFVCGFGALGTLAFGLDRLPRAGSDAYVGIGAFNLVRRADWERIGGHRRLALEVVDDVKLGMILRRSGVPQGAALAGTRLQVRWQHGFLASAAGLVKNAFAATEYRLALALSAALALVAAGLGPPILLAASLAAGQGAAAALAGLALALGVALHAGGARRLGGGSGLEGVCVPLTTSLLGAVLALSALTALARGGVRWRGTFYPLEELRRGCVRSGAWPRARAAGWGPAKSV
jgi:GT2 family glycosyltransferase